MLAIVWQMLGAGLALVFGVMAILWLVHLRTRNAGIVDFGWALNLGLLALLYFFMSEGEALRKYLITAMACIWSFRLAFYLLFTRYLGQEEEGRYRELRRKWKTNLNLKFFIFFQAQALLDLVLSAPFLLACLNANPGLAFWEWIGFGLWLMAFLGETLADWQLHKFKSDPRNRGKTCRAGLWNYSRHPNYFFESLLWVAYFVFAAASPYGWISVYCPVLMLLAIFKVTGIPATEAQALRSKGEDYRDYQRTTSMFVPWFKKQLRTAR